jgi:hypothetical protein
MRALMLAPLAAVLCGCVATYTKTPVAIAQAKLKPGARIAVATPRNGAYGDKIYTESGTATAAAVRAAFARYAVDVTVVPECQIAACLHEKVPAASYLAVPEILHW